MERFDPTVMILNAVDGQVKKEIPAKADPAGAKAKWLAAEAGHGLGQKGF